MTEFEATGGGRVGRFSATWPFVKLYVTANRLEINASIGGKYVFAPEDVISFDYAGGLTSGIRINHKVAAYSDNIIFSSTNSRAIMDGIIQAGFTPGQAIPAAEKMGIVQMQDSGGFAFKTKPIIAIIVIWNAILVGGILTQLSHNKNIIPTLSIQCATGFMVLVCLGMIVNQSFAEIILKPGRTVRDVKSALIFIMLICGFMFVMLSFIPVMIPR